MTDKQKRNTPGVQGKKDNHGKKNNWKPGKKIIIEGKRVLATKNQIELRMKEAIIDRQE